MSLRSKRRSQAAAAAATDSAQIEQISIEVPPGADPDHHLWRNGRLWWIAFTVHRGHQQERVRLSLGTDDVLVARARRDELLGALRAGGGAEDLAAFRGAARRAGARPR